jgi:aspartyl-tRNA(Asn)/glutamyl-tRNA(Gln) amidotransferase subunit A
MTENLAYGEIETAAAMRTALSNGAISSVELVERALRRLEAWEPTTNAFSQVRAEAALAEARQVGDRSRHALGPLSGIPVAVKDLFDVAGMETTGCCAAYAGLVAVQDAPVVAAWRRAGAIIVGKTNQHELAAGGTNLVSACGPTKNPWDVTRMTGGSSGGSAAAVASGVVPIALGSDTGGSIRIPAALCGCFGLKPTHGRLPLEGAMPLAPSLDCAGPIAGTVEDLGIALVAFLGSESWFDRRSPGVVRIGIPSGVFEECVQDEVLAAVGTVAEVFSGLGHGVAHIEGRGLEGGRATWTAITVQEFWDSHPSLRGDTLELVSPQPRSWLERGKNMIPSDRDAARKHRRSVRQWFLDRLQQFEVLLVPTTPYPAPHAEDTTVDLGRNGTVEISSIGPGFLTCLANLAGVPVVTLPAGKSAAGLPVGISLVGRNGSEGLLLTLCEQWQEAVGFKPTWPIG